MGVLDCLQIEDRIGMCYDFLLFDEGWENDWVIDYCVWVSFIEALDPRPKLAILLSLRSVL